MNALFYTLMVVFIFVCLFLILLILIQKGRGGGLASAFGGGAGGNTAFGSKTGDVLTWATSVIFGVFLLLAIGLNLLANSINAKTVAGPVVVPPAGGTTSETTQDFTLPEPQPQVPPPTGLPPGVTGDDAPVGEKAPDGPSGLSNAPAAPAAATPPPPAPVEAAPPTTQPR